MPPKKEEANSLLLATKEWPIKLPGRYDAKEGAGGFVGFEVAQNVFQSILLVNARFLLARMLELSPTFLWCASIENCKTPPVPPLSMEQRNSNQYREMA